MASTGIAAALRPRASSDAEDVPLKCGASSDAWTRMISGASTAPTLNEDDAAGEAAPTCQIDSDSETEDFLSDGVVQDDLGTSAAASLWLLALGALLSLPGCPKLSACLTLVGIAGLAVVRLTAMPCGTSTSKLGEEDDGEFDLAVSVSASLAAVILAAWLARWFCPSACACLCIFGAVLLVVILVTDTPCAAVLSGRKQLAMDTYGTVQADGEHQSGSTAQPDGEHQTGSMCEEGDCPPSDSLEADVAAFVPVSLAAAVVSAAVGFLVLGFSVPSDGPTLLMSFGKDVA